MTYLNEDGILIVATSLKSSNQYRHLVNVYLKKGQNLQAEGLRNAVSRLKSCHLLQK